MTRNNPPKNETKKNRAWTYEHQLYIKRKFVGTFFHQGDPKYINSLRRRIAALTNVLGLPKTKTMHEILIAGLDAIEAEVAARSRGELPAPGTDVAQGWQIAKKLTEIYKHEATLESLEKIYQKLEPQEFVAWCEESGINYKPFLEQYTWRAEALQQSKRDRDWLREYLISTGERATTDIRKAAIDAGIISESNRDWDRLRKTAERLDVTGGRHGHWRWPEI